MTTDCRAPCDCGALCDRLALVMSQYTEHVQEERFIRDNRGAEISKMMQYVDSEQSTFLQYLDLQKQVQHFAAGGF